MKPDDKQPTPDPTDLHALLEDQISLLQKAHIALKNGLVEGYGTKFALTDKDARKILEITRALEVITATKVRLESHFKKQGAMLTPEELVQAAIDKIKSLKPVPRSKALMEIAEHHDTERSGTMNKSMVTAVSALASLPELEEEAPVKRQNRRATRDPGHD